MATVWILFTTFIGWLFGWLFTDDHEVLSGMIGFGIGLMRGFISPVDDKEH